MKKRLSRRRVAALDDLADVRLQRPQLLVAERLRRLVWVDRKLPAAGFEAAELARELGDTTGAVTLRHRAGLEGGEVAAERLVGPLEFRVDPVELCLTSRPFGVELGEGLGDRLAHQVLLGKDAFELAEDRLL